MTAEDAPLNRFLSLGDLAGREGRAVKDEASPTERAAIAADFGLVDLPALSWSATVSRFGSDGWRVRGAIEAKPVQSCVVTLQPVSAKVREAFQRDYAPDAADLDQEDVLVDLDEDDPPEPLGKGVELGAVILEHLALALDPYPRAKGVAFDAARAAPPGAAPLTDEAMKPFAALAALKPKAGDDA